MNWVKVMVVLKKFTLETSCLIRAMNFLFMVFFYSNDYWWLGLPNLKTISFGSECCSTPSSLRIENCQALESAEFKEKSFVKCHSLHLRNLNSLRALSFDKFCFRAMNYVVISGRFLHVDITVRIAQSWNCECCFSFSKK